MSLPFEFSGVPDRDRAWCQGSGWTPPKAKLDAYRQVWCLGCYRVVKVTPSGTIPRHKVPS